MKPERIQDRFVILDGWELLTERHSRAFGEERPKAIWTAFELADHYEACELVPELGRIADACCVQPQIDVRLNIVFVTVDLTEEGFDFAEAVDRELGHGQRAKALVYRN